MMQARKRRAGCGGTVMVVVGGLIGLGLLGSLFGGDDDVAAPASSLSPTALATAVTEAAEGAEAEAAPTQTTSTAAAKATDTASDDASSKTEGTAAKLLETLDIKGRAAKTGYSRDEFGASWADVDRNGCDTRNDILSRDLTKVTYKDGTHDCVVLTGRLSDPYTATKVSFVRGQDTSTAVQIDHVVALSDAWQKGAQKLDEDTRKAFANDPLNLLAVDGPANQAKEDGDAATWLPPNKAYRCQYVARQVAVKAKYDLWVTQAEHDAIARVLKSCPDQSLPDDDSHGTVKVTATVTPSAKATKKALAKATPKATEAESVYYANCTAARKAGAAPVRKSDPGYSTRLDRDGDGIGCE